MQIIELYIKGYKRLNGAVNSTAVNKLIDGTAKFTETIEVGDLVTNQETNSTATVTAIDSDTQLSLSIDLFTTTQVPYRITSDYFRADLFKDESISITDSLLNVRDIKKVFTPFSKQFNLPASKLNNKLFRHYENTDIVDSFDARYRHDAIIKLNGIDYKKGKIQFGSVQLKNNKAYSYKVTFFSDTVDLKEILGDSKLSSLNYGDISEFIYSQANILDMATKDDAYLEASGVLNSSDIKVPNIHHSKNMRFSNSGYKDNATGSSLEWTDLKPAIRLRAIIQAINRTFPQINITGFLDSIQIQDIYLWLHRNEGYITNSVEGGGVQVVSNRWKAGIDDYTFTSSVPSSYGDVRGVNIQYPPIKNRYVFYVDITVTDPTVSYDVTIKRTLTDVPLATFQGLTGNQNINTDYFTTQQYGFGEIDITVEIQSENTLSMSHTVALRYENRETISNAFTLEFQSIYNAVNSDIQNTFYVSKQVPEMKVMDFLSGLFKMFNLVVFKEDNNIFTALASQYMNIGNAYDITKYVDMESSTLERLFQYKEMDFKFKSKKSFLVQFADEINGVPFAEEDYGSEEWDGKVYNLEVPFEKMMYERLSNEDPPFALSDIGQGAMIDKKFDATIGEPLLLCMDYTDSNGDYAITGTTADTYWRPTQLTSNNWGNDVNGLALNFGEEIDEWLQVNPTNYQNLFSANYFDYVDSVFDRQARMLKVSAYLPLSIITKYKLNDRFIIANKSYRINSIKTNLLTNKTDLELYNKEEFASQLENSQVAYLGRVAQLTEATKGTDFITVSWSAVSGATGYNVYYNGTLFSAEPNTTIALKVSGLESDTWYNIEVRVKYTIDGNDVFSFDTGITAKTD